MRGQLTSGTAAAVLSLALGYGARIALGFGHPFDLGALVFVGYLAHRVFFSVLWDSLRNEASIGRITRNIGWFIVFAGILICLYAAAYSEIGLKDGGTDGVKEVATCLYFSVITWTTVGYGDVVPTAPLARLVASLEALNGSLVVAIFITALVPTFQRFVQTRSDRP